MSIYELSKRFNKASKQGLKIALEPSFLIGATIVGAIVLPFDRQFATVLALAPSFYLATGASLGAVAKGLKLLSSEPKP